MGWASPWFPRSTHANRVPANKVRLARTLLVLAAMAAEQSDDSTSAVARSAGRRRRTRPWCYAAAALLLALPAWSKEDTALPYGYVRLGAAADVTSSTRP